MALKTLMIKAKLDRAENELAAIVARDGEFTGREKELVAAMNEAADGTAEERATVEAAIDAYDEELIAHTAVKAEKTAEIEALKAELEQLEKDNLPKAAPEAKNNERTETMQYDKQINIRALPMNQRVFDALPLEQRKAIVAQDDVQSFFAQLRSLAKVNAQVTGADLTIPVIFLDLISENRFRYSKLMKHVRVRNVPGEARQTIGGTIPEAVWTECCGNLNELNFAFNQITANCFKVAGFVLICNSLLNDSDLDLAAELIEMMSEAIGKAKDKAILYGKGAAYNMPMGIATRLAQTSKPSNYPANAPAWVDLHTSNIISISADLTGAAFWSALRVATGATYTEYSRGETFWAMNSKTYALLESKAITASATGEWVAMIGGRLPIVGGNVEILEFMPDNDIIGGYGDLYLWAQRQGMEIGTDVSGYTLRVSDNTLVWGKERGDGQPIIAGAFVAINIAGSTPTTSMTFPGDAANTLQALLLPPAATLAVGAKLQLNPVPVPFGLKATITYASSDATKASVDSATGVVTGVAAGSAVITATSGSVATSITVTVPSAG